MKKVNKDKIVVSIPHPVKLRVSELPGPALTNHTYSGFGKELCKSLPDSSEEFEEKTEVTEVDKVEE